MTTPTANSHRSATIILFSILAVSASIVIAGVGSKYGTRDPYVPTDRSLPKTGPISAAQAKKYVIADTEKELGEQLYLAEDVIVQVGKGRPYNPDEDINFPDIDTKFPIYPIRGSLKKYDCSPITQDKSNLNHNCSIYNEPNAKGACYKDTFGDWSCAMTDTKTSETTQTQVAPPGKVPTTSEVGTTTPPTPTKENTDAKGFPKLDTAAFDPWYEVVKYEYVPTENRLYFYLKLKVERGETEFFIEFKDKDGLLLQDRTYSQVGGMPGYKGAEIGDTVKVVVNTPNEKILKQAVSAKMVRRL
ncbi:hypothetical protein IAD21_03521 [Abditibacteriota bacterium]|nr:hypothetical protein IAD21_03521 [Abditibacteriota bacterium]